MSATPTADRLLTIGHGTASQPELAALLTTAGVAAVVDVRRFPGSRRHPQFARESLARWLPEAGVGYGWEEALGGRRRGVADSPHRALRNASFRAYADHMDSLVWRGALDAVLAQARDSTVAVMCSESLWWRCHRRLIADVVTLVHGWDVGHLRHDGRVDRHRATGGARRSGGGVVYDGGAGEQPLFGPGSEPATSAAAAPGGPLADDPVMERISEGVGLAAHGEGERARALLDEVWAQVGLAGDPLHRCALAHALADVQDDPIKELAWDLRALEAASKVTAARARAGGVASAASLRPSLHLNLADVYRRLSRPADAAAHVALGHAALAHIPEDGYTTLVRDGLTRVADQLEQPGAR